MRELAVDWPPLAVNGGRIVVGYGRATFLPEGLRVGDETFAWDDLREPDERGTGWAVLAEPGGYPPGSVVNLVVDVRGGPPYRVRRHHVGAGAALADEAATLAGVSLPLYLRDVPEARAGLGVPLTVSTLLRTLRRQNPKRPKGLPREPWMGDKHDLHHAVLRGLGDVWPHWYALRGVAGEPVPSVADAVAAVRSRLRPGLRERFSDDEIAERAEPYLRVEPWPFSLLLPGAAGP